MPKRGVTLAEVEAAVQALRAAASTVTTRNVRQALGERGSLTTLVTHLRVVRQREAEQEAEGTAHGGLVLPDPVVEGLVRGAERHWAALNDAAEAIVAEAQAQAQDRVEVAREAERQARMAEEGARAAQGRTAATLVETERALEALRAAHTTLVEEHRGLRVALGLAEERGRGAESLATERKEAIEQRDAVLARTQGELGEVRDALEHHRAEAATRERTLTEGIARADNARREEEDAAGQLRVRLGEVESALEQVRAERDETIGRCEESQNMLDAERRAHARTESELATFKERCAALGRALERSEHHGLAIAAALDRSEERAARTQALLEAQARGAVRI